MIPFASTLRCSDWVPLKNSKSLPDVSHTERPWSRRLQTTRDGSPTLEVVEWGVCYHSIHGALTESVHVFIERGLDLWMAKANAGLNGRPVRVLEVGFGTGLNASLAWGWAEANGVELAYVGLEPYPLNPEEARAWAAKELPDEVRERVLALHGCDGARLRSEFFSAHVVPSTLQAWDDDTLFDVCFFDAFAPAQQPEMWSVEVFQSILARMHPAGRLSTYCAKGQVRRDLEAAGWKVERHPGPPGKREMLVALNVPVSRWNVRCYALILNPARTHVLMARERFPDGSVGCKFPGGGVEEGEFLVDTLWRECQEELGTTEGLEWIGHAYTNDFFVRSAFADDEQILSVYHWLQADHEGIAWWDEKPENLAPEEPLLEMNWEAIASLKPEALRFPIDRHVAAQLPEWVNAIR